jgi:hypothetical protein
MATHQPPETMTASAAYPIWMNRFYTLAGAQTA